MFKKPLLISISPNTNLSDAWLALMTLFKPWSWQKGRSLKLLSTRLKAFLNQKHCYLLNSGRIALELGLQALNLKPQDEVLCQAFTCVAVPNAIKWAGAKPVFVDTLANGFNLDLNDLRKKITKNSKALIIQHTFGRPDDLKTIKKLCRQHQLTLIEDCAHSLGAKYHRQLIGSFSDLAVLSFGRDKTISSVFGGAVLTSDSHLAAKLDSLTKPLKYPALFWIFKQLLHPLAMTLIVPLYFTFNLGKMMLFFYQKSGLLTFPVAKKEKQGRQYLASQMMPNALAGLTLHQFNRLTLINQNRQKIAACYQKALHLPPSPPGSIYMRFPLLVAKPQQLIKKAKKKAILLGNWYRPVIAPQGVDLTKTGYQPGSCPHAEAVSQKVVNLPTHPKMTLKDAQRIIKIVKDHHADC